VTIATPTTEAVPVTREEVTAMLVGAQNKVPEAEAALDRYIAALVARMWGPGFRAKYGRSQRASDLRQECASAVWEQLNRFLAAGTPKAYLRAAVQNKVAQVVRAQHAKKRDVNRVTSDPDRVARVPSTGPTASDAARTKEAREVCTRILQPLSEADQQLLRYAFAERLSYAEIAERTGLSADTAKKRVARLLRILRDMNQSN
jgi:RNA polymerase sigma factor (sigma-70 family)